ncbi:MAG: hypothetical protein E7393_01510 [Ruminococcaceae bacterium]|nr:hypothetical protein [Oscillospiraceae bacterium]
MTVQEFIEKNNLEIISQGDLGQEITGCYIGDLLSLAMSRVEAGQVWMTVQGNVNIAAVAALTDPSCILLVEGRTADATAVQKAREQEVTVLKTDLPAYEAACLLFEQNQCK